MQGALFDNARYSSIMAYCDFYAVRSDILTLLQFLHTQTDLVFYEMYSDMDCELRRFDAVEDVMQVYDAEISGRKARHTASDVFLLLWPSSIAPAPAPHRFDLDYKKTKHHYRYRIGGHGLLRLYLGGLHDTVLIKSTFGHAYQGDATRRGIRDGCDYDALRKLANRIQYHIRKRLAVAQTYSGHILQDAFNEYQNGKSFGEVGPHNVQILK